MSKACRLLFIADENAELMMVTVEKLVLYSREFSLLNSVIVLFESVVASMEINRRHYFQSNLPVISMWLYFAMGSLYSEGPVLGAQYQHVCAVCRQRKRKC